ncbi:MAG: amidohydrolase family protein [Thermodesulfobacteriota bacterium]|nr:amidohydrolase family protein [Thermodesulfobacteriota bacterium]
MFTVLEGACLFTGEAGYLENAAMVFKDDCIHAVGKKGEIPIPEAANYYDVTGKYILPGLIDVHIHLDLHGMGDTYHESLVEDKLRAIRASLEMGNTVRAGFTTVRNAGSANYIDVAVKRAVMEGLIVGPRILASGRIICMMTAGSEYFEGLYREADGVDENRKAAREQLKEGVDCLKVMATGAIMNPGGVPGATHLDADEIRAVVEEGAKTGKHTAAHAHGAEGIKNAIKAGVRTIEHGTLADDDALKMMADEGIFLTSTLSSNFWMLNARTASGIPHFMFEKAREISRQRQENLHRALYFGVRVAMGTDAGTPYNYHGKNAMELIQYVKLGLMSPIDAVLASTRTAADAIGMLEKTGTLDPGKFADCVVFEDDPLADIDVLESLDKIAMVFKAGELITGRVDTSQWSETSPLGVGGSREDG